MQSAWPVISKMLKIRLVPGIKEGLCFIDVDGADISPARWFEHGDGVIDHSENNVRASSEEWLAVSLPMS